MRRSTPLEAVRCAASGSNRAERRGLAVLAAAGAAISLFVLGLCVGQLIGGDVAAAAGGAPALVLLALLALAARGLIGGAGGGEGTSASSASSARARGDQPASSRE